MRVGSSDTLGRTRLDLPHDHPFGIATLPYGAFTGPHLPGSRVRRACSYPDSTSRPDSLLPAARTGPASPCSMVNIAAAARLLTPIRS